MARTKKIIETHGKVEEPATQKPQPTLLEQTWGGFNEMEKYGTIDESEYLAKLDGMNRSEMEAHARKVGVVIVEHTPRLKEKLLREFQSYASSLRRPLEPITTAGKAVKVSDEVRKILAEGR